MRSLPIHDSFLPKYARSSFMIFKEGNDIVCQVVPDISLSRPHNPRPRRGELSR